MAYTNPLLFANNAGSSLAGPITNIATTLNVQSGGGALFPNPTNNQAFVVTAIDAATGLLREIMLCTSRSTDTLTVVRAQEGTTALSWLAGDLIQELWTAGQAASMLQTYQLLTSVSTYYVNFSTGNDAWTGTSATQIGASNVGPFKTPQGAVNAVSQFLSVSAVTIMIADNVSYGALLIPSSFISQWIFTGNVGTPANVVFTNSSPSTNQGCAVLSVGNNILTTFNGITFVSNANNVSISVGESIINTCVFTAPTNGTSYSVLAVNGAQINITGSCSYSGSGAGVIYADTFGHLAMGTPVTTGSIVCTGSPTFSGVCAGSNHQGSISLTNGTISGTATGTRAAANLLSLISLGGHSQASGFAGNADGSGTNGGIIA
jgi:hypothetical protein